MAEKLKPCPFCGGEAYIVKLNILFDPIIVGCKNCGCSVKRTNEVEEAVRAWNRRVSND